MVPAAGDSYSSNPHFDHDVPARIAYVGKPSACAVVDLIRRPPRARGVRAIQGLAACWGLAVAAVFVPVLHFILVPGLLLGGLFLARARWREEATLLAVRGDCPGCGQPQSFSLRQPARAQVPWRCPGCGRPIAIEIDPAVIAGGYTPGGSSDAP